MRFESLRNVETSFRLIRRFSLVFVILCAFITGFSVWSSYRFAERQREKIYVLAQGKSMIAALSENVSVNRPAEAREHVREFHEVFFTLAPDRSAIDYSVKSALVYGDKSIYNCYRDLEEKGYYNRMISGNINQTIRIDSIVCDLDTYPYKAMTYARQIIIRESNVTERSLVTSCNLLNVNRTDDNLKGFFMENFVVLDNREIGKYDRR